MTVALLNYPPSLSHRNADRPSLYAAQRTYEDRPPGTLGISIPSSNQYVQEPRDQWVDTTNRAAVLADLADYIYEETDTILWFHADNHAVYIALELHHNYESYPLLDEDAYYLLEQEDADEQWSTYQYQDVVDTISSTKEREFLEETDNPIADDIQLAARWAAYENSSSAEGADLEAAAHAIRSQINGWHALYAWHVATSGGMQETLPV